MTLTGAQKRKLKSLAQKLDPRVHLGKAGIGEALLTEMERALTSQELVKVRFDAFKEEKDELAAQVSEKTGAILVARVGHTAVFFRRNPDPDQQRIRLD